MRALRKRTNDAVVRVPCCLLAGLVPGAHRSQPGRIAINHAIFLKRLRELEEHPAAIRASGHESVTLIFNPSYIFK